MIYFNELGSYGRLGNQLFQYAAAKSLAIRNKTEVGLVDLDTKHWHGQQCLLSNFNLNYTKITIMPGAPTYNESPEDYWKFNPSFFSLPNEVNLHGFFQNINYFKDIDSTLCNEFTLKDDSLEENCKRFLSKFRNPTSIHLRLGDLMDQFERFGYKEYLKSYITQALKNFDKEIVRKSETVSYKNDTQHWYDKTETFTYEILSN